MRPPGFSTSQPGPDEIRRLKQFFTGSEPRGSGGFIAVPKEGQPYAKGTMVPLLGVTATQTSAGGVVIPRAAYSTEPLKYISTFIGLEEYLGAWLTDKASGYDNDLWIKLLVGQYQPEPFVIQLAFLNNSLGQPELLAKLTEEYEAALPPALLDYYKRSMAGDENRVFLARQPILRAIREVLLHEGAVEQTMPFPMPMAAIMLAHAFATKLGHLEETGPEIWPTVAASVAMEVIQNYLFNQQEDIYPRLDRYSRLWDEYGPRLQRTKLRASPNDLLHEATGVERGDLFAVAFLLLAHNLKWKPGDKFNLDPYPGVGMNRSTFDAALGVFTTDAATLKQELRAAPDDWEMLPFERHPVLRLSDASVVVLDAAFLLEAVTSGLYWMVLNQELQASGGQGKEAANLWSQAYSEMIEALAEDILRSMAPPLLGNAGKTFYTEEDIAKAYGGGTRRCDAAIDFGQVLGLFEVQKGQVSLDTRQTGLFDKFTADTERMVLEKAKQLQDTADAIFRDETALTGFAPTRERRILPVAVEGITYPVNPITDEYIDIKLKERGLLRDPRFGPFAVVDLGELEMLEGLRENGGVGILDALEGWKAGPGRRFSLRNHLLETYAPDFLKFRPKRMAESIDSMFKDLLERLKLAPENPVS